MSILKGEFREVVQFGVSRLMNPDRTVAQFKSWQDVEKGTSGAMSRHRTYRGVPITQEELDKYYYVLKKNTGLTKSKIGSGKVLFRDLKEPIAIEYQGKVYLAAPFVPPPIKAFWIQKSPSAAAPLTSEELLTRARELGKDAYGYGFGRHTHTQDLTLSVLCHNPEQEPSLVVKMIDAWKKGWQAEQKATAPKPKKSVKKAPPSKYHEAEKLHRSSWGLLPKNSLDRLLKAKFILEHELGETDSELYRENERLIANYKRKLGLGTPAPSVPAILTPAPAAASDLASVPVRLGGGGIPPIPGIGAAAAPKPKRRQPAAASDMASVPVRLGGGGIAPIPGVGAAAAPKPKRRQPAAKPAAKRAAAPPAKSKAKKAAAKPVKAKNGKPAPELTAAQRKRLNATGRVTIKRNGKFVTITR